MRFAIALAALLGLSACGASLEEQTEDLDRVSKHLPDGCELVYAGNVRVVDGIKSSRVFVVDCPSATTVSSQRTESSGKTTVEVSDVAVRPK